MQNTGDVIKLMIEPDTEVVDDTDFNQDGSMSSFRDENVAVLVWAKNCSWSVRCKQFFKAIAQIGGVRFVMYELRNEHDNNILTRLNLPVKTPSCLPYYHGELRKDQLCINDVWRMAENHYKKV